LFVATIFTSYCGSTANPAAHPELVIAVMNAASSDWAAARLGVAIERVADACWWRRRRRPDGEMPS
jgi:hypothetical protein